MLAYTFKMLTATLPTFERRSAGLRPCTRRSAPGKQGGHSAVIGDRLDGVRIEWREHRFTESVRRGCVGAVEHIGPGWLLIRRPRGGLAMKRLRRATVEAGRLSAQRRPNGENLLLAWIADDEAARAASALRRAEARARHDAERAAQRAAEDAERAACEAAGED
jgi:hypothetical protein